MRNLTASPSLFHKLTIGCLLLCCVWAGQAQSIRRFSTDGTTAPALEPGAPAGSYALSGFDNVNLFNGNLNFAMPLLKMGGRGAAGYSIGLKIEKKWRVEYYRTPTGFTSCGNQCYVPVWGPEGQHYYPNANWWSPDAGLGPGRLVGRWGGLTRGSCTTGQGGGQLVTTLSFITNDGSEITFRDDASNGQPYTISGSVCSSTAGSRGTGWHSINGEGASFVSDATIYNSDMSGEFYPSGYLLTKDGTRTRIDSGNVTWTRDRNGNKISFTYDSYNRIASATDSLNRQVTFAYGNPSPTVITFKGFGGATRTLEIGYNSLGNALRYDQTLKTYQQLWPDLNEASVSTFNPSDVVSYVKLPDGRFYYFKYNSYGELARVELPTGGAFDYDWSGMIFITTPGTNTTMKEIRRWATEKRIYVDGGTGASYTTRTTFGSSQGNSPTTGSSSTYNASNTLLASETHYYYGGNFLPSSSADMAPYTEGKEYGSVAYNGATLVKSISQTWENRAHVSWYTLGYATEPANDPRISDVTTTLNENNLVSKVHTDYDDSYPYNNPKDVWEYGFGSGAPGSLLRRTHTEYAYVVSGTNYATDTNIHLRALPSLMQVFDGASPANKKSETTLEYDVYSGTNHAALVDRTGIVGLDVAFTTSKTTRGNVTAVTQWIDSPNSTISGYAQYDIAGNVVKSIDPKGNSDSIGYADNFSNTANNIGTYAFATSMSTPVPDPSGTYASSTALSVATKFDYDTGKAVQFTDANNQITTMDYTGDALDRPKQVNKPDGGITTFSYGDGVGAGNLYVRTQSKLNATQWTDGYTFFDGLGRAKQTKSWEGGTTWSYKDTNYDALGRAYQVSNPYRTSATDWTTTTFDQLGRVTAVMSPDNAVVSTAYYGNQVLVTDQAGKKRMSETDAQGRLTKVWEITPADTQTVGVTFPGQSFTAGYLTTYGYDTLDNLITVNQQAGTSGTNQNRSFVYDSLKRLKQATNPEGGTTTYTYDLNSNLYQKTDALGITVTYNYDNLNRNTTIGYSSYLRGTSFVENHYDNATNGKGKFHYNVKYNTEANGTLTYNYDQINSYDVMGRPTSKSQNFLVNQGGYTWKPFTTTATYDLVGNLLSETYPSGRTVNYAYDQAGRANSFTGNLGGTQRNYATDLQYTAAGLLTKETFGTGTALYHRMNYNVRQQLFAVRVGTESATTYDNDPLGSYYNQPTAWNRGMLNWHYGSTGTTNDYGIWGTSGTNNNGNVLRMHHWLPGAGLYYDDYEYDALNRIAKATEYGNGSFVQQFDYDRWGNRTINQANTTTSPDINKKLFSVDATNNRLGVPSGQTGTMSYDAVGNLTNDTYTNPSAGGAMEYDAENHMTSAVNGSHQYRYNAEGKRVRRIIASQGEFWMVYGISGELVAEYNATSGIPAQTTPQKEYGYRNGQLLVLWDDSEATANLKMKWLVQDHLGSTRMEIGIDGSSSAIVRHDYLPFGEELGGTMRNSAYGYTVDKTKQKFTGYERDTETGLDFAQARYMSSVQGRFTGVDPLMASATVDSPQTFNRYTYALNNPLRYIDPTGMDVQVLDEKARRLLLLTLPEKLRSQVNSAIDKDGLLKKGALDDIKSKDANFLKLQKMTNHADTIEVGTASRGNNGVAFFERTAGQQREMDIKDYLKNNPNVTRKEAKELIKLASDKASDILGYYGQTYTPNGEGETPKSPSGRLRAIATDRTGEGASISEKDAVVAMGHELYNHSYKFMTGDPTWKGESGASVNSIERTTRINYRGQGNKPKH